MFSGTETRDTRGNQKHYPVSYGKCSNNPPVPKSSHTSPRSLDTGNYSRHFEDSFDNDYFASPKPPPTTMKYIYNGPYCSTESKSKPKLNNGSKTGTGTTKDIKSKQNLRVNDSKFLIRKKLMRNMQYTSPHWKSHVFNPDKPKVRPGLKKRLDEHVRNPITWEAAVDMNSENRKKCKYKQPLFELTMSDTLYLRPALKCRKEEHVRNPITWEEMVFKRNMSSF